MMIDKELAPKPIEKKKSRKKWFVHPLGCVQATDSQSAKALLSKKSK